MKHLLPFIFICCLLFACKEKQQPPRPVPEKPVVVSYKSAIETDGFALEMEPAFPDTMRLIPYRIINRTDDYYTYDSYYLVERYDLETGKWINMKPDDISILMLYPLEAHDTVMGEIWNNNYPPGYYRLTQEIAGLSYTKEFRLIKTIK